MAITPETDPNILNIEFASQPTLTYWRDPKSNRLQGTAEGLKAMTQAVEVILNVERFQWQIYTPYTGMQWEGLIGQEPGYVASEMQRRMTDAFSADPRILGIKSFSYTVNGDSLIADVVVATVYGSINVRREVNIR